MSAFDIPLNSRLCDSSSAVGNTNPSSPTFAMSEIGDSNINNNVIKMYDKPLRAISTANAKTLKVSNKLAITKSNESMQCVCNVTGIIINVEIPAIPNKVLEYLSPFSIFANAKGIIYTGEPYLQQLETQILAGLWITAYRHYDLLSIDKKSNGVILNAMLRTAGKQVLIDSLLFVEHLSMDKANKCPKLSLDYTAHKESSSIAAVIQEYTKVIRDTLYSPREYVESESFVGGAVYASGSIRKRTKPVGISDIEKEYELLISNNAKTCKILITSLSDNEILPIAFITLLKQACSRKNLSGLNDSLRSKLADKLISRGVDEATRLAKLIKDSKNPYDIFAEVDSALDRASDTVDTVAVSTRRLTMQEILAAKKDKANTSNNNVSNVSTDGSDF